jgi:hypothetical protein
LVLGVNFPAVDNTATPRGTAAVAAAAHPGSSSDQSSPAVSGAAAKPAAAAPATSVASGLQRWRAAVSSTTVNLIQRRLAGTDEVSGSDTSSRTGAASSPEAGQQLSSGGSSSEAAGAAAAPLHQGQRRSRGRLPPGDSQSLAAAAAVGSFAAAGSSITRGSGGLQLRRQLGQVRACLHSSMCLFQCGMVLGVCVRVSQICVPRQLRVAQPAEKPVDSYTVAQSGISS